MAAEIYRLTVRGHLDSTWSAWFDGLSITLADNGDTVLTSPIVDQSALHGVLIKIRDLGLPLLALTRLGPDLENADGCIGSTATHHEDQQG